jgi:hypothetical protein
MNNIFSNWTVIRAFRLAIGIMIIVQGARSHNLIAGLLGGMFALMAIANWGCCGANGCRAPRHPGRINNKASEDVIYEEVK